MPLTLRKERKNVMPIAFISAEYSAQYATSSKK